MADPEPGREPGAALGDALARALEQAERERRRLGAGDAPDNDPMTRAVEDLEQLLAAHQSCLGPAAATSLVGLLDELGRLIEDLESAKEAARERLATDRRHQQAGRAYRRAGRR